jgi:hypothetical protein
MADEIEIPRGGGTHLALAMTQPADGFQRGRVEIAQRPAVPPDGGHQAFQLRGGAGGHRRGAPQRAQQRGRRQTGPVHRMGEEVADR